MSDRPDLMAVTELPEAMLRQLVAGGEIMSVTTFDEHMRPDVHWIAPSEYREAFEALTGEENMTDCAAYTKPEGAYPGYVNVTRDHTGAFILTARGDPTPADGPVGCGQTTVITIPEDDWHQFMAMARRLQVPKETDDVRSVEDDSGSGAVSGDPLAQRTEAEDGAAAAAGGAEPTD